MRRPFHLGTATLAAALALGCGDGSPTSPLADQAATPTRPFGGTCTFQSTVVPPAPDQPPNVTLFHADEVCHLTHLGLTTAVGEEVATFTPTGPAFVTTVTYTAANGDQLFTTETGSGTPPDASGVIHFSGTEMVNGGTGRFADASGSFSFAGSVTVATRTGEIEFPSGTLSY